MTVEYDENMQELLLRALISEPEIFTRCQSIINKDHFNQKFRKTVEFVLDYSNDYNAVPNPDQIEANCGLELELLENITTQEKQYYLDEIEKFSRHKALIRAILDCSDFITKGDEGSIEKTIKDALLVSLHKELGTDYYDDPVRRLQKLKDQTGDLSTGLKTVDKKLYNVGRGEILLLAAPSGGGKSMVLQNLAVNFSLQNLDVVFITLELSEELTSKRMDSMVSGIPNNEIYKKIEDIELMVKKTGKRSGGMIIKYMPASSTTTLDIKAYLKEYEIQKGKKPDIMLVDYLDLLAPNNKKVSLGDYFLKDKLVSEELRSLSKELDMLTVTASQFNRGATDAPEFDHSHIAGGKSKIDTADNVIGIHNSPSLRERGEVRFQYLKTRNSNGVGSYTNLNFDIDTLRITDKDEDEAEHSPNLGHSVDSFKSVRDNISRNTGICSDSNESSGSSNSVEGNQKLRELINKNRRK